MITEERVGSSVLPGRDTVKEVNITDIENECFNLIAKKGFNLTQLYTAHSTRCNNTPLKDIIINLEQLFKVSVISDEKKLFILNSVFETLKAQFKILESLVEKEDNEKITVVLYATIFSYFKKFFL